MQKRKKWLIKATEPAMQLMLARKLGVSPLMAQLLINRGIYTERAAREFLNVSFDELHPPELMRDLTEAVSMICQTLDRAGKIWVYGDYDADGVTGTTLLVHVLRRLGGQVEYYIPQRLSEGYGLHTPVLQRARTSGVELVITVDCGISAVAEVDESNRSGGPAIIITDHHEPPAELPRAAAVINPKRKDCRYPFGELAGVGVAFKLAQALLARLGNPFSWEEYLDLVCLGTIADIVPLKGENRILVKYGLPHLSNSARPGIQALCQVCGIQSDTVTAWEVGFLLAPRINAAGRLDDAGLAVEMLLSDDYAAALATAELLNKTNQERQNLEAVILADALGMLEQKPELADRDVLVLASADWHPGVIGIVASRLVDRFYKPILLIACADGLGKGSARSVDGFHLYQALEHCAGCLTGYGGHALAAGFSLPVEQIDELREQINAYADEHISAADFEPVMQLDALVPLQDITFELINELEQLVPYGHGNPGPLFAAQQARVVNCRGVGKNNAHLKMRLSEQSVFMDGIGFNLGQYADEVAAAGEVSVAFTPEVNTWQGRQTLQVKVQDVHVEPWPEVVEQLSGSQLENSLECAGDLILVPETITHLLRQYMYSRGYPVPPEMNALGQIAAGDKSCTVTVPMAAVGGRSGALREKRLARLSPSPGCTLLVANCAANALQVYRYIEEHNEQLAGAAIYLHGYLPSDYVVEQFAKTNRHIKLAVVTPVCLPEAGQVPFDRIMLVRPPAVAADWQRVQLLAGANPELTVESLYGAKDWEENRSWLAELAPDRDVLAHYYTLLRSLAPGGVGSYSKALLLERMAGAGCVMHTCISLIVAAAVFADLGLLQFYWQEDMLKYKLLPVKGVKKNLTEAPTFNWAHSIKSNGLQWIDLNIKASGA